MEHLLPVFESLEQGVINSDVPDIRAYEQSYSQHDHTALLMVKDKTTRRILVVGQGSLYSDLEGTEIQPERKVCPLSHHNRLVLNRYFEYTVPRAFGRDTTTMGLGDRLGIASPGHIQTVKDKDVKPILAQQSIRELSLTGRTMEDVLDAAGFAVFQEGYKGGFGADGDHLKKEKDIEAALEKGMSMLTLDCSDHIHNEVETAESEQIRTEYEELPQDVKDYYSNQYLKQTFQVGSLSLSFDEMSLMKNVLLYRDAIGYMVHINNRYIREAERDIDFEISIDETATTTTPLAHFFVANELEQEGVHVTSLAPRFCGEFQKGIDYIGDVAQFEKELEEHVFIADQFGYKLSIHSGSDKFKVFPLIAKYTHGHFHIKTAGTNWLEAIRVIAETNPALYRRMHVFALEHFEEALQYYHVTPDLEGVLPLERVTDDELANYMNDDAARQLFHVTYGILLTAKDKNGRYLFKDELFSTLEDHEDDYKEALIRHIGKHLEGLGK